MRVAALAAAFLLHGSGIDEALFVGVPLVLFAVFRWLSARRERRQASEEPSPPPPAP